MNWITIPAFLRCEEKDTPEKYSIRCAEHQGRIAAAAKDDPEKSCYYRKGSREHLAFMDAYRAEEQQRRVAK